MLIYADDKPDTLPLHEKTEKTAGYGRAKFQAPLT